MKELFKLSPEVGSDVVVVDNFYKNPDAIREFALRLPLVDNNTDSAGGYKGLRSKENFRYSDIRIKIQESIGEIIHEDSWNSHTFNGCFQITSAENSQVYHCDQNSWAGVLYLTPDAPVQSGTRTHISKSTGLRSLVGATMEQQKETFEKGFYDSTKFDIVDSIGNIYNRLVLFRSHNIHSAGPYFGLNMWDGRLVQLFFFDTLKG